MNEIPMNALFGVLLIAALSSVTTLVLAFFTWRALLAVNAESTVRSSALMAAVSKLPTLEETRSINRELLESTQEEMTAAVRAALPADLTPSMVMETLERVGVHVPPPLPVLPDPELQAITADFIGQGIALAEETARQNLKAGKPYAGIDKRRVCLNYVRDRLREKGLEYPESRLALDLEKELALMRLPSQRKRQR